VAFLLLASIASKFIVPLPVRNIPRNTMFTNRYPSFLSLVLLSITRFHVSVSFLTSSKK
jgi:hypothetical protein